MTDAINSIFVFTLTRWLAETDGDLRRLGLLGACSSLSYALSAAVSGHLSDRFGRRRLIATGAVSFAAAYGLALHSLSLPLIYAEAALAGLAIALVFPPLIPLLNSGHLAGDRGRASTRPIILFCLSWNLGVISGNVTAGSLFPGGPELGLWIGLALCLVHLVVTLGLRVPPPSPGAVAAASLPALDGTAEIAPEPADPGVGRDVMRFFAIAGWAANVAASFAMSLVLFIFPRLLTSLDVPAPVHGAMIMSVRVSVIAVYFLLHFTGFWRYRLTPAMIAQLAAVAGLGLLGTASGTPALTAGVMLIGVMMGYNYFTSIFYSTTGFDEHRRGLATGLHEVTLAIGFTGGAFGGGYFGALLGMRAPYLLCAGIVAVSLSLQALAYAVFRARTRSTQTR